MKDLTLPNVLTAVGLCCGVLAVASAETTALAASWIIGALILDRLDGIAARKLGQSSDFGARLDSLADLVSFGIAPVFVVGALVTSWPALAVGVVYAVCAAWRLAAFHDTGLVPTRFGPAFVGVPVPGAAAWLLVLIAFLPLYYQPVVLPLALAGGAACMLSPIKYPKNGVVMVGTIVCLTGAIIALWTRHG